MALLLGFIIGLSPAFNWGGVDGLFAWTAVNFVIFHYIMRIE